MIFRFLGRLVRRAWVLLLFGWGFVGVCAWLAAPPWDDVAIDREFAFLPDAAPSRQGEEVFAKAFPDDRLTSNIVLVLHRRQTGHGDEDRAFIASFVYPGLRRIAEDDGGLASEREASDEPLFGEESSTPEKKPEGRSVIARIRTPAGMEGALLVSPDERAMLVVAELTVEFLSKESWPTMAKVESLVSDLRQNGKIPSGLEIAITGSAAIGRDHSRAVLESGRATTLVTVLLVVLLL